MARLTASKQNPNGNKIWIFGLCGTLSVAWLGAGCGENTERVLTKIPTVIYVTATGGTAADANSGGATSGQSGGGGSGGTNSTVVGTGGLASGGAATGGPTGGTSAANTGPAMSAVGAPIGFAAVGGSGTTGGGRLAPIIVTTCADLKSSLEANEPSVIVVDGNANNGKGIDCTTPGRAISTCQLPCDSTTGDTKTINRFLDSALSDCSSFSNAISLTPTVSTRNEQVINVQSNKTLIGKGTNPTIAGATLYLLPNVSNIIIQNLNFTNVNPTIVEAGDAITIDGANHVWVDHCYFSLISDGFIDAVSTNGTVLPANITISWNHFNGINSSSCGGQHNYANTFEHATATFHHNFYDHTLSCSPKATQSSSVSHIFNNYWLNVLYYSVGIDKDGAQALIEDNYFQDSLRPYWGMNTCISKGNCAISDSSGSNKFAGTSTGAGENKDTGGTVGPMPYDPSTYQIDDPSLLPTEIPAGAGPTLPP